MIAKNDFQSRHFLRTGKGSLALGCVTILSVTISAGVVLAGFQVKRQIGRLRVGDCQLETREGRLGLAKCDSGKWSASAPTIMDANGRYIAIDPEGKSPTIHLVKEKGSHANWAFEFTHKVEPGKAGRNEGLSNAHLLVGKSGFSFKMKVANEGPFKNWYVGLDPLMPDTKVNSASVDDPKSALSPSEVKSNLAKTPEWRALILVQDPKAAINFEYIDTEYEVGHK
jgi:hypothetical protein